MKLNKYFSSRYRMQRSEYWRVMVLIAPIFYFSTNVELYLNDDYDWQSLYNWGPDALIVLLGILSIVLCLTVVGRRYNDIGIKGWYQLIFFLPLLFQYTDIILIVALGLLKSNAAKDSRVKTKIKKLIVFFKKQ